MTFAEQMVAKLQALLLANPGAQSVSVDGQQVTYADLTAQLDYWGRKVARAAGTNPAVTTIDLSSAS